MCASGAASLADALDSGIDGSIDALNHIKCATRQDRTIGIALLTFGDPSQEMDVIKVNVDTIGAADDFRDQILVGLRNQRTLCGGADGITPSALRDDIAKDMGVDILAIEPLRRVIVAVVGL